MRWWFIIVLAFGCLAATPGLASMAEAARAYARGDYAAAADQWRVYAAQGSAEALFNLGQLYRQGLGVDKDAEKAEVYYTRAAERGHAAAQSNLGTMLYFREPNPNRQAALEWWRKAAAGQDVRAQYMLGVAYINGDDVSRDVVNGYAWLTLAAAGGIEGAVKDRLAVRGALDVKMRIAAEALAREINPNADLSVLDPGPEEMTASRDGAASAATAPPAPVAADHGASETPESATGTFMIQLGAFASERTAFEYWNRLKGRNEDLLAGLAPDVRVLARGPGQDALFRLRAGSFAAAKAADAHCAALQSRGISCFKVGKRPGD